MKKNKRNLYDELDAGINAMAEHRTPCPICDREQDETSNEHHLIPKSKKGKDTVLLHGICHSKIHSLWTEAELNNYYHTIERIMENEEMQKFAKFMSKKPLGYKDSNRMTNKRNPNKRK